MKISLQAQDLVFELLSDKVTDLLDSSLMFIEVLSSTITIITTLNQMRHEMPCDVTWIAPLLF